MQKKEVIIRSILIVAIVYVFILSIKLMSTSFKLFGTDFAEQLISITANPFTGLFIGILATSIVQSSSVTTSIIVGLAAGGALTVGNAIPIIMGANIGTSVTNTIVCLSHITRKKEFRRAFEVATVHDFFNFIIVLILFPIELHTHFLEKTSSFLTQSFFGSSTNMGFSSPLSYILKPVVHSFQNILSDNAVSMLLLSFFMLFFSLRCFVKIIEPLAKSEFKNTLNKYIFKTPLRSFSFGLILTGIIQSSSVSTSLIVPLAGIGILTLKKVFPYIMGANIGTTFTALIASLATGSPIAVTVALNHVLFNTFGSAIIYPIRTVPINLSRYIGHMALKSRIYPLIYIATAFFILPSVVIFLF